MSTPNGQKAQIIVEELIEAYKIDVGLTLVYLYPSGLQSRTLKFLQKHFQGRAKERLVPQTQP
jgi:hypothetical protein